MKAPAPTLNEAKLPDYIVVFKDDRPPKEAQLQAVSDQHATGLMEKQYPELEWTLFRVSHGERTPVHTHEVKRSPEASSATK